MQFLPSDFFEAIIILRGSYRRRAYLGIQRVHHFTDLLEGIDSSTIRVLKQ